MTGRSMLALATTCSLLAMASGGTAAAQVLPSAPGAPVPAGQEAAGNVAGPSASADAASVPADIEEEQAANPAALEEIVVTAQKRSQSVERVPASIQVQTGETIIAYQQVNLKSIAVSIPNLVLTTAPSGSIAANIRGFGTPSANAGFEQTVALYVDGLYAPRPQLYTGGVYDIDRIEVVKGTQGALFGKNASVGAISLLTSNPGREYGGYYNLSYNLRFEQPRVEGAIDTPIGDRVRLRFSGLYDNAARGWVRNVAIGGSELPTTNEYAGRAKAEWDVTDTFRLNGKLEFDRFRRSGDALMGVGGRAFAGQTIEDATTNATSSRIPENNGQPESLRRTGTQALGFNWDVGKLTVTGLSGWQTLRFSTSIDVDRTAGPADIVNFFTERFRQFTQEVRIATPDNGPISALGGFFYLNQDFDLGLDVRQAAPVSNLLSQRTKAYSAFGQVVLRPADRLTLTTGLRYTHEIKEGDLRVSKIAGTAITPGRTVNDNVDWSVAAEYELVDAIRAYATVSRGSKAPGFVNSVGGAAIVPTQLVFPGERATNFEVGLKGRFLDNRGRASVSVYQLTVDNFQAAQAVAGTNSFQAASRNARARGMEAEVQFRATTDLRLNLSGAYNDAKFRDNGNQLIMAPRWNGTASFDYSPQLSDAVQLQSGAIFNYVTRYPHQFDMLPGNFTPSHINLDARIGVKLLPSDVTFTLLARNLTNERYADFSFGYPLEATAYLQQVTQPRNVSIAMRVPF